MGVVSGEGFPIKYTDQIQGFRVVLKDDSEVRSFLVDERDFWAAILQGIPATLLPPQQTDILTHVVQRPIRYAIATRGNQTDAGSARDALGVLDNQGHIFSKGKQGRLARELAESSPVSLPTYVLGIYASTATAARIQQIPNYAGRALNSDLTGAAALAASAHLGSAALHSERRHLDELTSEVQAFRDDIQATFGEFGAWSQDIKNAETIKRSRFDLEQKASLAGAGSQLDNAIKSFQERVASSLEAFDARVHEFENQVKNRIIVEAPTAYWRTKADGHRTTAAVFGTVFMLVLGISVWGLIDRGPDLIAYASHKIVGDSSQSGLLVLVPLAFITLPALAVAWVLRHVSRIIIQNLALEADARLRGTIATTYGALTAGREATGAELAIALNALFRPIEQKDHAEIAPPNLGDILEMAKRS